VKLIKPGAIGNRSIKKLSFSGYSKNFFKEFYYRFKHKNRIPYSVHRNKFIVQQFIPDLNHDYKLLIYGHRAYLLERGIRTNDFRASGSGKFKWPQEAPQGILDYGLSIKKLFKVPHISLDIAQKNDQFYLLEAQFVQFGPLTMERSPHHWEYDATGWVKTSQSNSLESVFVDGIATYLKEYPGLTSSAHSLGHL